MSFTTGPRQRDGGHDDDDDDDGDDDNDDDDAHSTHDIHYLDWRA